MTLVFDRLEQVTSQGTLGETEIFGQTFRAYAADLSAVEVAIDVDGDAQPLTFRLLIAGFGGGTTINSLLYTSAPVTVQPDADFNFDIVAIPVSGLNLVPEELYAFLLDSDGPSSAQLAVSFVAPTESFLAYGINLRGQELVAGSGPVPGPGINNFNPGVDLAFRLTYGRDEADTLNFSGSGVAQGAYADLNAGVAYDGLGGQPSTGGISHLRGGAGADALVGNAANNQFAGGAGVDSIFGGHWSGAQPTGDDLLDGGDGNDGIWGFDGRDYIRGEGGDDGIVAGAGDDTAQGGEGSDVLFGGDFTAQGACARLRHRHRPGRARRRRPMGVRRR